ncbi:DUF6933 domain-containing protein [Alteribacter aurantiacus]|uniref:DUF6933 domain-containing protein n=1 Tax=Alteribacter aurantiacus TaxID=254410 RepID=UPI00041D2B03|nr:hypothetical protein [Alteribacter aurantiacus]
MLIQCTQKLLKEIKVKPSEVSEEERLYCWHANVMMMGRRKALVLMNDSSSSK